jgi:hypothetical protein
MAQREVFARIFGTASRCVAGQPTGLDSYVLIDYTYVMFYCNER